MDNTKDIVDLALSYWELSSNMKNSNQETDTASDNSLKSIKAFLDSKQIEFVDLTGSKYTKGLAVNVVESFVTSNDNLDDVIILKMIKPVIVMDGSVVEWGVVTIGVPGSEQREENIISSEYDKTDIEGTTEEKDNDVIKNKHKPGITPIILSVLVVILSVANLVLLLNFKDVMSKNISDNSDLIASLASELNSIDVNKSVSEVIIKETTDNVAETTEKQTKTEVDVKSDDVSEDNLQWYKYDVEEGETLYSICIEKGIDYTKYCEKIIDRNELDSSGEIYYGQSIYIPELPDSANN